MRPTIQTRIAQFGLSMTVAPAASNPHMAGQDMDHWRCTIKNTVTGKRIVVLFSQGSGHKGAQPELPAVLSCLASDAAGYDNARDFADWCSEYGYSDDSRKAEKTYRACGRTSDQLKQLVGSGYDALLFDTESL